MDAAAELGRNPVSKHQIQPEYGDEQADAGRYGWTRLARPNSQARTGTGKCWFSLFSWPRAGLATFPGWSILCYMWWPYIHTVVTHRRKNWRASQDIGVVLREIPLDRVTAHDPTTLLTPFSIVHSVLHQYGVTYSCKLRVTAFGCQGACKSKNEERLNEGPWVQWKQDKNAKTMLTSRSLW